MQRTRSALLAGFFFGPTWMWAAVPWTNGEKLTYEVNWGMIVAAEAVFTAHKDGAAWILKLDLKSRGLVETLNPIRSFFTSSLQPVPWRSLGFDQDRSEGEQKKKSHTTLNYSSLKGRHEDLLAKTVTDFDLPHAKMDDMGSLLYAIRLQNWRRDKELVFTVYDGSKIKFGRARFVGESTESVGVWPKQKLLLVEAWPEDEKGKRKKGSLKLWITDDEKRVPLKANFIARFGTFEIDLIQDAASARKK